MNSSYYNIEINGLTEHGYVVPDGYSMDETKSKGKREGAATVWNENNEKYAELWYKNDKLNGLCKFYISENTVVMIPFDDNEKDGILRVNVNGEDTKWIVYEYDDIIGRLERSREMDGYMKKFDTNGTLLNICQYDNNYRRNGKCYIYCDKKIKEIFICKEDILCKDNHSIFNEFKDGKKYEYEYEYGQKKIIYEGEYEDDILKDYPRNGQGKLYKEDGKSIIYDGLWLNNIPDGKGQCNLYEQDGRVMSYTGKWNHGECIIDNSISLIYMNNDIIKIMSMSINNKSDLLKLLKDDPANQLKNTVNELIIEENCCKTIENEINLSGYSCLESIVIKKNSLVSLKTLKISNNPKLRTIEIEDGIVENNQFKNCPFDKVKTVEFSSMNILNW